MKIIHRPPILSFFFFCNVTRIYDMVVARNRRIWTGFGIICNCVHFVKSRSFYMEV